MRTALRFAIALTLSAATGCATTASDKLRANAEVVQRETTPDLLLAKGDAYAAVGDATRAEQYFAASLAAGGNDWVIVRRLVRICVSDQRIRAALAYSEDHLRRHPQDHEIRFARATLQAAVGNTEIARTELERLLEIAPKNPEYHFAMAVLLRDGLGDGDRAREHFALYLKLAPEGRNADEARAGALSRVER